MLKRSTLDDYRYSTLLQSEPMLEVKKSAYKSFDIFLCHSSKDKDEIKFLKAYLQDRGLTAYVDWVDDPLLDRNDVSEKTAQILQMRMEYSDKLFFVLSKNSSSSVWMPWELGYFDKKKKENVYIFPIIESYESEITTYKGQEYLGLYPIAEIGQYSRSIIKNEKFMKTSRY